MKKWSLLLLPLVFIAFASCDILGGKIEAPSLSGPADGAEVSSTPTLSWSSVEGATGYKLEIDDADDFSSTAVSEEVTEATYTVATALAEGTYYWHVAAKDENDDYGDYSTARSFKVTGGGLYDVVGSIDFDSDYYPNKCMVSANTVYMTAKEKGLVAIDVSNPTNPAELDIYNTEGVAWDVYIDGSTAYVGDQANGIVILDVSDPSDIMKTGEIKPGYDCRGVYATGGYLYVTASTGSDGVFLIYDLADTDTFLFKVEFTANAATEVCVISNTAYISGGNSSGKLWIYDVSDPAAPVSLGDYTSDRGGGALNITVVGNTVYLSNWNQGLEILDVSDPANITRSGYYMSDPTNAVYEAKIDGNIAYVANSWGGLMIVDLSDPMNPEQLHNVKPEYISLLGLDVAGNYAYCPDNGAKAFHVVKVK